MSLPAPTDELLPVAEHVWVHEAWVRFLGFPLKTRMTVIQLPDGGLWLHSPIGDPALLRGPLGELGEVRHLVAPNALHHLGLETFGQAFPEAQTWATRNVAERSGARVDEELVGPPDIDSTPTAFRPTLEVCVLGGNVFFEEALVLHRRSKTLIVTDFIERIDASCTTKAALAMLPLADIPEGRTMPAPEHRSFATDPAPLERARDRVLSWDIEQIIIAHGPNVVSDPKAELEVAFKEAIAAATGRGSLSTALRRRWAQVMGANPLARPSLNNQNNNRASRWLNKPFRSRSRSSPCAGRLPWCPLPDVRSRTGLAARP